MEIIKNFLANLKGEDKRKYIAYIIVSFIGIFSIYGIYKFNNKSDKEVVTEFGNPDAEESKVYNKRAEASMLSKDTANVNTSLDNVFGNSATTNDAITGTSGANSIASAKYVPTDNYTAQSYGSSKSTSKTQSGISSPKISNSHSTYGDYSMWQTNEPSNSSISYSDQSPPTPVPTNKIIVKNSPTTQNPQPTDNNQTSKPSGLSKEQKLQNAIANKYSNQGTQTSSSVIAEVYNSQQISGNNATVRLVLKDNLNINNTIIGTDAFILGVANIQQNAIQITVPNISYKGVNYQVNLIAYDYTTGQKGVPIQNDNIVGVAGEKAESQAKQEIARLGRIGGLVSSILSGKNKSASIQLNDGHRIYLKSK